MLNDLTMGSESILIVDDEEMILDVGKLMLETLGYRVFTAKSGKDAIETYLARKEDIDMIVLDMIMPDMGGKETFDELACIDPDVVVLLSSGYGIDDDATGILKRGRNGFIQKPFDMKRLSEKIREVLDTEKTVCPESTSISA